jgi:hypothetical protein
VLRAFWEWAWLGINAGIGLFVVWVLTQFIGRPFLRFFELRDSIEHARLELFMTPVFKGPSITASGATHPDMVAMEKAKAVLRNGGFAMQTFAVTSLISPLLLQLGYDASRIAEAAQAFANFADGALADRMKFDKELKEALRVER